MAEGSSRQEAYLRSGDVSRHITNDSFVGVGSDVSLSTDKLFSGEPDGSSGISAASAADHNKKAGTGGLTVVEQHMVEAHQRRGNAEGQDPAKDSEAPVEVSSSLRPVSVECVAEQFVIRAMMNGEPLKVIKAAIIEARKALAIADKRAEPWMNLIEERRGALQPDDRPSADDSHAAFWKGSGGRHRKEEEESSLGQDAKSDPILAGGVAEENELNNQPVEDGAAAADVVAAGGIMRIIRGGWSRFEKRQPVNPFAPKKGKKGRHSRKGLKNRNRQPVAV